MVLGSTRYCTDSRILRGRPIVAWVESRRALYRVPALPQATQVLVQNRCPKPSGAPCAVRCRTVGLFPRAVVGQKERDEIATQYAAPCARRPKPTNLEPRVAVERPLESGIAGVVSTRCPAPVAPRLREGAPRAASGPYRRKSGHRFERLRPALASCSCHRRWRRRYAAQAVASRTAHPRAWWFRPAPGAECAPSWVPGSASTSIRFESTAEPPPTWPLGQPTRAPLRVRSK